VSKPYPDAYRALAWECDATAMRERDEARGLIAGPGARGFAYYCGGRGQPVVCCRSMVEWDAACTAAVRSLRAGGAN
jgi:hypothetical protein